MTQQPDDLNADGRPGPDQEAPGPDGRAPERPGPYQGVYGATPEQARAPQYPVNPAGDRPGPYPGVFGQPGGPGRAGGGQGPGGWTPPAGPGQNGPGQHQRAQPGGPGQSPWGAPSGPGPNAWGHPGTPYAYQAGPVAPPKQVTIASVIAFGLAGLSLLLALFAFTSAGESMAELMTGDPGNQGVVALAAVLSAALYVAPAVYVRKRRPWARTMLIVLAALGIAGGLGALPGSLLGMAIHVVLLVTLLQQPTKLWFQHR